MELEKDLASTRDDVPAGVHPRPDRLATLLDRPTRGGNGERMRRTQELGELAYRGEIPQLCGRGLVPATHSPSSFFQIGAWALISSMISLRSGECRVAVGRRRGDDHGRLGQRDHANPVLRGRCAQAVASIAAATISAILRSAIGA